MNLSKAAPSLTGEQATPSAPATWRPGWRLLALSLVVLLIGALGVAYRIYEFRAFAALPTGFDGPLVFRQRYLLEQGRPLLGTITSYSYWSAVVNAQLGSYLMELINAGVLALAGALGVAPRVIHQILLTLLLSSLGIALLARGRSEQLRVGEVALVTAMLTLGTPVVINFLNGWNVAYAWAVLLAVSLIYISRLPTSAKLIITIALAFMGPPLYHSFGFLLTVFIMLLWFVGGRMGFRHVVPSPPTVGIYYLTYQIYVSTVFFGALIKGVVDVVTLEFLRRDAPVIAVSRISAGLVDLQQLHIVLYGLLSVPILACVVRLARRLVLQQRGRPLPEEPRHDTALLLVAGTLGGAVAVFAIMFGLKFSVEFLINRGASYMIIPATLGVIYELRRRGRYWWYVVPIVVLAVGLSLYSFHIQSRTVHMATNFTHAEAEGYAWLRGRLSPEDVVFTDFRLSGAFIADGHLRVLGVTGEGAERTDALLQSIYYAGDSATITAGIDELRTSGEGRTARYLFLSTLMMEDYPGLNGYSSRFEPTTAAFFAALDTGRDWQLIHDNGQIRVYERAVRP